MKRPGLVAGVLAVALAAPAVLAQSKPDFAGKWTLVPEENAPVPGRMGGRGGFGGLGQEFVVTQDDKTLTVTTNSPQMGETKAVYRLDGSESSNPLSFNGNAIDRVSKVRWDGAKMVVTTTMNFNGSALETTQTWMFDKSGNLVVESLLPLSFGGQPGAQTLKATYKKG